MGYLDAMAGDWSWSRSAPFAIALQAGSAPGTTANFIPECKPVNRGTGGLFFEYYVDTVGATTPVVRVGTQWLTAGSVYHYLTMQVDFTTGGISVWSGSDSRYDKNQVLTWTWSSLKVPQVLHVGFWLTWSATGVPTVAPVVTAADNVPRFLTTGTFSAVPAASGALSTVSLVAQGVRVEAFQVSTPAAKPATLAEVTQAGTWKKSAVLDLPTFPMRVLPAVSGSAWDVITEIARATLATAEFDRDGFFRWRGHTRWATVPNSADVTVTSARELGKLVVTEEIDACRNDVAVQWTNWARIAFEIQGPQELPTPVVIPAGGTVTRTFSIDTDQLDPRAPDTGTEAIAGYMVIRATAVSTSAAVFGAVEAQVLRVAGTVTLTLRNRSATPVYYHGVSMLSRTPPSGSGPVPSLATATSSASQSAYGVQSYEHDAGGWIQDLPGATQLANALRDAGAYPVPLLGSVEILADPRVDLGDVVRVVDTSGAALDTLAWVVGIQTASADGAVTQSLTLRGATNQGWPTDVGLSPDPPTRPGAPDPV
ncbi:hypothetical protein [Streptomyces sp. NBC_00102]|uniref:hypothetical protein n=1 Tax=Streptomyces sp. NBC_00102 TaxID=2975652 RepID=UPI00224F4553|nr:hypothetical protein [Streptomyces sp. NBC_00102]MCX5398471.1 hypothetical protein [Streptomyces sp. NBC_00102]